jgi:hypothetical protein
MHYLKSFFDIKVVNPVVKVTIVIVDRGIRIAAITGESVPCTAKYKPAILYTIDRTKLPIITCLLLRA